MSQPPWENEFKPSFVYAAELTNGQAKSRHPKTSQEIPGVCASIKQGNKPEKDMAPHRKEVKEAGPVQQLGSVPKKE